MLTFTSHVFMPLICHNPFVASLGTFHETVWEGPEQLDEQLTELDELRRLVF
jgi:hypothetical protein